jgi:hypothetical protein
VSTISSLKVGFAEGVLYYVVFSSHDGAGAKYLYDGASGLAIELGSDPRDLPYIKRVF